jgi:hypothetical protein
LGFRVRGLGFRVWGCGVAFRNLDLGLGFRVWGCGVAFRNPDLGLGFMVYGLWFREGSWLTCLDQSLRDTHSLESRV